MSKLWITFPHALANTDQNQEEEGGQSAGDNERSFLFGPRSSATCPLPPSLFLRLPRSAFLLLTAMLISANLAAVRWFWQEVFVHMFAELGTRQCFSFATKIMATMHICRQIAITNNLFFGLNTWWCCHGSVVACLALYFCSLNSTKCYVSNLFVSCLQDLFLWRHPALGSTVNLKSMTRVSRKKGENKKDSV